MPPPPRNSSCSGSTKRKPNRDLADLRPGFVFPGDVSTVADLLRALPPEPRVTRAACCE
jgi:hypothetical protein